MVVNSTDFITFRQCKRCHNNKTAMQKNRLGQIKQCWYIDKESPQGGWICYYCYHNKKVNAKYMISEIEFTVNSTNIGSTCGGLILK